MSCLVSIEQHANILLEKKLYSLKNHVKMFTEEKHFVQITVFENDSKNYRFNSHTKKNNVVSTLIGFFLNFSKMLPA